MIVQVHFPSQGEPLHPYVISIFRVGPDTSGFRETILPKGNVDLLFNLGPPMHASGLASGDYLVRSGAAWISGLRTRPFHVEATRGMDLLGVSLHADAAALLLPLAPGELLNREAFGPDAGREFQELSDRLWEAGEFARQRSVLTAWLLTRMRPRAGAEGARRACVLLRHARADDPVHGVARTLGVSTRHLRRLVTEHVGIGPAEYVRLWRFTEALRLLRVPGRRSIGAVAQRAGYYDHAHFCRDFRRFGGVTPQEYRRAAPHPTAGHILRD